MFTPISDDDSPTPTEIRGIGFRGRRLARVPTTATYQEVYSTLKSLGASDSLIVSIMAVMSSEQPAPTGYNASNYNFGGVDITNSPLQFNPDVHNGYVVLKEGGTGQYHAFASFKDLRSGLKFKLEKLQKKGFDKITDAKLFAVEYYKKWNGLAYRTLPQFNSIREAGGKNNDPYGTSIWAPADTQAIKLATNSYVKIQKIISDLDRKPAVPLLPAPVAPSTPTLPGPAVMIDATGYIDQVYKQPFRDHKQAGVVDSEARNAGTFSQEYQNFLNTLQMDSQSTDKKRNGLLILDDTIKGDLQLIAGLASAQVASEAKVTHIAGTILSTYSLTAKQDLVTSQIFEMSPDRMRLKMAQNAEISTTNNSSHAWRAPGKLSITADITIPGTAGFRMGQIFWIDRIVENYKKFGAFQIFGISEHIDISKGWTTTLHSRFNALPRKLLDQKILYDDEAPSNPTLNNPTQATPTNP